MEKHFRVGTAGSYWMCPTAGLQSVSLAILLVNPCSANKLIRAKIDVYWPNRLYLYLQIGETDCIQDKTISFFSCTK